MTTPYTTPTGVQIGIAHLPRPQINDNPISGPFRRETRLQRLGHALVPFACAFALGFVAALLVFDAGFTDAITQAQSFDPKEIE